MNAPERFAVWMSGHIANDHKFGRKVFRYHPRSDEHSKMLCKLVLEDLVRECPMLASDFGTGTIAGGTNIKFGFPNGKVKSIDLAIGTPAKTESHVADSPAGASRILASLRFACEAKQCMTEHSKTQPRIYDELSSSHEIVHQGDTNSIACGIVVVNIAPTYASPTRQTTKRGPLIMTQHRQPDVTARMIEHLRGLKTREKPGEIGFDAFATIVISCDNVGVCRLHTEAPAPQPGDFDHYTTFLQRVSRFYAHRFGG